MLCIGADTETTGNQWQHGAECFNACLAAQEPFKHSSPSDNWNYLKLLYSVDPKTRTIIRDTVFDDNTSKLRDVFHNADTHFVFHNMKFDLLSFATVDVFSSRKQLIEFALDKCRDSIHLSHLVNSLREHALKPLAASVSDIPNDDETDLKKCVEDNMKLADTYRWNHYPAMLPYPMKQPDGGWWKLNMWLPHTLARVKKKDPDHTWWHICSKYCGTDAKRTLCVELDLPIDEELKDGIKRSRRIQHHATVALLEGELNGIGINYTGLVEEIRRLEALQEEWYSRIKREVSPYIAYFNPGSSLQMKEHCFKRLGLPVTQYTKKMEPSTGKLWLAEMISLADSGKYVQHTNFLYAIYMWKRIKTAITYLKSYVEKAVHWTSPQLFSRFSSPSTSSTFLPTWYNHVIKPGVLPEPLDASISVASSPVSTLSKDVSPPSTLSKDVSTPIRNRIIRPLPRKHPSLDSTGCSLSSIAWLHPNHNPTGTKTTRLSCKNPNGQQVGTGKDALSEKSPLKRHVKELALNPRKFFVPDTESILLSIDYSQLQLALFAQLSGEAGMVKALLSGEDLHSYTARVIYNLSEGSIPDKGQRTVGKNVNFGFIFGAGEKKMRASTAGVKGLKRILSQRFPDATAFMTENMAVVKAKGYVLTPGGYPLYVPEETPYAATNYIIQGAEGEIVKAAMSLCGKFLREFPPTQSSTTPPHSSHTPPPSLIMQIHDELLFRVPLTHLSLVPKLIDLVRSAGDLFGFHLEAEGTIGLSNWGEGIKCTDQVLQLLRDLPLGQRLPRQTLTTMLSSLTTST